MLSTWMVLLATSTVPITLTFFPSYGLAFSALSSTNESLLAASLKTYVSPFLIIVPENIFSFRLDSPCSELAGRVADAIPGTVIKTKSAPARESTILFVGFIGHLTTGSWLDKRDSARIVPVRGTI